MKILSFGAGMQSTALALMSCENAFAKTDGKELPYPLVPIYDIVIFCDLGLEPVWVRKQADFVRRACETAGIQYKELDAPLYQDLMRDFGKKRVVSIPWWTIDEKGHKSKFPRNCTLDYKVQVISKYVRWELLGYRKHQRLRDEDKKAHEMHLGVSFEEKKRCKESPNPMLTNHFPLVEMKLTRADNYAYILDAWGLDTKASACCFCRWPDSSFLCPAMRFSVSDFANTNPPAPEKSRGDRCLAASPFFYASSTPIIPRTAASTSSSFFFKRSIVHCASMQKPAS